MLTYHYTKLAISYLISDSCLNSLHRWRKTLFLLPSILYLRRFWKVDW